MDRPSYHETAREQLPLVERYDTAGVRNPERGYDRRVDAHVVDPLADRRFVAVEEHSKYQRVSVTESGSSHLRAFRYLIRV